MLKNQRKPISERVFEVFLGFFFLGVLAVTLYPFLNVLAVSLNDSQDSMKGGIGVWPRQFTTKNYEDVFGYQNLQGAFLVSVARTVVGTALSLICTCMLAFTLSRKDYLLRQPIAGLFLITLYVSGGLIPVFMTIRSLGLIGNFWVYILPGLVNFWNVIVIRSFMENLPPSLQEAALIDGANDWTIFWRIILPLCLPVVATISLFLAVGQWNSWIDTFLYANGKQELSTLQYELMKILNTTQAMSGAGQALIDPNGTSGRQVVSPQSIRMTITIVATVPILLVYPFIQKYFVTGLTLGAVKS